MTDLSERVRRAQIGGPTEITSLIHDGSVEVLEAVLRNPFLQEDHLLTLLNRKDLAGAFLETVAKNPKLMESQRVKAAVAVHPKTPRRVALNLMKFLYLFDLVRVSLQPGVLPDLKRIAEGQILARIDQLPLGQQVNLARRGPPRVAAAILESGRTEVLEAALENPRMTEAELFKLFQKNKLPQPAIVAIARHRKWSLRYDLKLQVVRHPQTSLGLALELLPGLRAQDLRLLRDDKRMRNDVRGLVEAELQKREDRGSRR